MEQLQIGDIKVPWLKRGETHIEMEGQCLVVVPKVTFVT